MNRTPIENPVPKYAIVARTLQERITSGEYAVATMLPTDADLVQEFGVARGTLARAMDFLSQRGYISGHQGKGRLVLGPPLPPSAQPPRRVSIALHGVEATTAAVVGAGRTPASLRIATALGISVGDSVVIRLRLMTDVERDWRILSTVSLTAAAAHGTALHAMDKLPEGALDHFERRRSTVAADAVEHLSLQDPSERQMSLLKLARRTSVLVSLLVVRNAIGAPLLAFEQVMAVPPQGIEEIYQLRLQTVQKHG